MNSIASRTKKKTTRDIQVAHSFNLQDSHFDRLDSFSTICSALQYFWTLLHGIMKENAD